MPTAPTPRRLGRPPGADGEQTRRDILDAALAAFAERGFDGASIREITSSIGVGHNLVRHYFGSKEDLWRAAMHHGLESSAGRVTELLESAARDPDGARPVLQTAVEILVGEWSTRPDAARIVVAEALRGGPRFDEIFDRYIAPVGEAMLRYLAIAETPGRTIEPRMLGLFVFSTAFGVFSYEGFLDRLGFGRPLSGDEADDVGRQLVDLIVNGLGGQVG